MNKPKFSNLSIKGHKNNSYISLKRYIFLNNHSWFRMLMLKGVKKIILSNTVINKYEFDNRCFKNLIYG